MSKTFSEWIKERRTTVMLPSGIEAEVRLPSAFKLALLGPLPQLESIQDEKSVEIAKRYVNTCLARLGDEKDPIGRGILEADDLPIADVNAIVDTVISIIPKEEVREDGVPLADTDSPAPSPESSTG